MAKMLAFAPFAVLIFGLEAGIASERQSDAKPGPSPFPSPPSNSTLGNYTSAAVVSDVPICSQIGRDILLRGGNAADAAIATLFCVGVVNPQNSGIGGGSFTTIVHKKRDATYIDCINGRESAPLAATENMFGKNPSLAAEGPLSIAVPGELAASYATWKAYGKLKWKDLVMPAATLAKNGVRVTKALAAMLKAYKQSVMANPSLSFFINNATKNVWQEGDFFIIPQLGNTLMAIAENGADTFYNGQIADYLIDDLQAFGSIITLKDLQNYRAKFVYPIVKQMGGAYFISHPPPASGVFTAFILNVLQSKLRTNNTSLNGNALTYHWIVEAFKHGFGQRTNSGDPDFVPSVKNLVNNLTSDAFAASILAKIKDDKTFTNPSYYGDTSKQSSSTRMADDDEVRQNPLPYGYSWDTHVSVIDGDGMAVSVTSGINTAFASRNVSVSTGIFLNSCMGDFSAPGYPKPVRPANFIKPGKRPQSSKTPTILVNALSGLPIMAVGSGAGGPEMITSVVQTIIRDIWFGENIKQSIDDLRLHHSLNPMILKAEPNYPSAIISFLKNKGHTITTGFYETHAHGVSLEKDGFMYANADYRNGGDAAGF